MPARRRAGVVSISSNPSLRGDEPQAPLGLLILIQSRERPAVNPIPLACWRCLRSRAGGARQAWATCRGHSAKTEREIEQSDKPRELSDGLRSLGSPFSTPEAAFWLCSHTL